MSKKVTIIFPCLNEEATLEKCLCEAKNVMEKSKYRNDYEILVCDNDSTDKSVKLCEAQKCSYCVEKKRGYGNACMAGIKKSTSKYVIMLDCDMSYETKDIPKVVDLLEKGNDLVVGNRFKGGIKPGAMSVSHHIGVKFLTNYANLLFRTGINDYHCGLRGFDRKKLLDLGLTSGGFEFASEMIIKAKLGGLKSAEFSTTLYKDGRGHRSHLRAVRDGFRHLHIIHKLKFGR